MPLQDYNVLLLRIFQSFLFLCIHKKKEGTKFGIIARRIKIVNPDKIFYVMKTKNVLFLLRICFTETNIVFL